MRRISYELARCPVCGAAEASEIADSGAIRDEIETLWEFHGRRLRPDTPPRFLVDRVAFSQHPPVRIVQCTECTHLYRNPRERAESLARVYGGMDGTPDEGVLRALFETQLAAYRAQVRRLAGVVPTPGRLLEVGSYVGGFLAAARDAGWQASGVDLSADAVAFSARQGASALVGTIGDVAPGAAFDVIAIWNTFEQLYDARAAVLAARERLRARGILALRVPSGAFYARWRPHLHGPLRALATRFLAHNNLLGFPYRQGFTRESLARMLRDAGFHVVRVFGDTLVPIADRWTTMPGALDERITKRFQRAAQRGWRAPWVETYARAT